MRLYDLTEGTSREQISEYLSAYGDIISAEPEIWDDKYAFGGIETGVWIVKMMVTRNIPSYITIDGDSTYVAYYGQRHTCRHCGEYVHNGTSCVQNKKLLMQKLAVDPAARPTYANVTKTKATSSINTKKPTPVGSPMLLRSAVSKSKDTTNLNHADKQPSDGLNVSASAATAAALDFTTTSNPHSMAAPMKTFKVPRLPNISGDRGLKNSKGNDDDTDDSTTSSSSRRSQGRPPGKKQKHYAGFEALGDNTDL